MMQKSITFFLLTLITLLSIRVEAAPCSISDPYCVCYPGKFCPLALNAFTEMQLGIDKLERSKKYVCEFNNLSCDDKGNTDKLYIRAMTSDKGLTYKFLKAAVDGKYYLLNNSIYIDSTQGKWQENNSLSGNIGNSNLGYQKVCYVTVYCKQA